MASLHFSRIRFNTPTSGLTQTVRLSLMLMSVCTCDLNRSTQHSKLFVQGRSVADETKTSDSLHR